MIYLFESELSENKQVFLSLIKIFGFGKQSSLLVCRKLGFSKNLLIKSLCKKQKNSLIIKIENLKKELGSELKKINGLKLKRLVSIKCYRGLRMSKGLPVRGQRTHDFKFVDNARFKHIRQTIYLKNAVKGTAIVCSSIGQCTKTRLNAISFPTAVNTVYSYRVLSVGIYFSQLQQQANYLVSYCNSVFKMNLSKFPNTKLSFVYRRIGDIHNKVVIRKLLTGTIKKNIKDTKHRKLLNESEFFNSDLKN